MKPTARLLTVVGLALAFCALPTANAEAAARMGRLRGVVRDQGGGPLVGVTVAIFDAAAAESEKPIRNAVTDGEGRFTASIAPGRYMLRAIATGFGAVEARALVAANRETVIDSLALRRVNTLADRRRASQTDPYGQVVRTSRGQIFHIDESPEAVREGADARALALTDTAPSTHGAVQTLVASGPNGSYAATNFVLTRRLGDSDVTVAAQTGLGATAPQRVEALAETSVGETHRLSFALGHGRLVLSNGDGDVARVGQYTLQATDRWQVAGPLVVVYGLNYSRFSGASNEDVLLPRLGVEADVTDTTQIFAGFAPGSSQTEIGSFDLETGRVAFAEPRIAAIAPAAGGEGAGAIRPDRSGRFQVGVGHLIDESSSVEVMAFFDAQSGRGVGLLAIPSSGADAEFFTGALDGSSRGMRVVYSRRISSILSGNVGYATGSGSRLSPDAERFFESATFQVLAAQLDADFSTGTRVRGVYRLGPDAVVFAIDPFDGRVASYDSSLSLFVTQSLPSLGFLPGHWEATFDVRNLLDAGASPDEGEVSLVDVGRFVRAGVSFRF